MFPPFIDSFGNQFTAVMINSVGSIMVAMFSGFMTAFTTGILGPLFKSLGEALGLSS